MELILVVMATEDLLMLCMLMAAAIHGNSLHGSLLPRMFSWTAFLEGKVSNQIIYWMPFKGILIECIVYIASKLHTQGHCQPVEVTLEVTLEVTCYM